MKPIIILGSSNSTGLTYQTAKQLGYEIFDIKKNNISYFDYEQKNAHDDFNKLMEKITKEHDRIILATPIYWYTMSAHMKTFIDRLTDLIINKKKILNGKSMYLLTTYGGSETESFETPFRLTANYMFMSYRGCFYTPSNHDKQKLDAKLSTFKQRIEKNGIYIHNFN